MGTISAHRVSATVTLPSVTVPAQEIEPGYTTQIPAVQVYGETFDAGNLNGWTPGTGSSVTVVAVGAISGTRSLAIRRTTTGFSQDASAARTIANLIIGQQYELRVTWRISKATNFTVTTAGTTGAGGGQNGPDGLTIIYFTAVATSQALILTAVDSGSTTGTDAAVWVDDIFIMKRATSVYTPPVIRPAYTVPGATVDLTVKRASITLDDAWSPYAAVELVCVAPTVDVLEAIDPRASLRATVTVSQSWGDGAINWNRSGYRSPVVRPFYLTVRERAVDKQTSEMTLSLTSDEGLLHDYALVARAPDTQPIVYQASLRQIVNYVLGKIGASVGSGPDSDMTVTQSPNLIPDPRFTTLANWNNRGFGAGGAGSYAALDSSSNVAGRVLRKTWTTASTSPADSGFHVLTIPVEAGETYTLRGQLVTSAVNKAANAEIRWYNSSGAFLGAHTGTAVVLVTPNTVAYPIGVTGTAPPGAATANLIFDVDTGTAWPVNSTLTLSLPTFTVGAYPTDYFDGTTAPNAIYTYSWSGVANASPSNRALVIPRSEQLLDWLPGVSAWEFIGPIVQAAGFRLWCDEQRVWRLTNEWNTARQINIAPATGLTASVDRISRNEAWYDSVVIEYRWTDRTGRSRVAYDTAGVGGNSTLTIVNNDTPFPGLGAALAILRRAEGKGRIINPEAINNYLATPGDVAVISLPDAPSQVGGLSAVTWRLPENVMAITTRGLTDTPAGAWVNAVGTWAQATGSWASLPGTN
jgi:hypothetical protein